MIRINLKFKLIKVFSHIRLLGLSLTVILGQITFLLLAISFFSYWIKAHKGTLISKIPKDQYEKVNYGLRKYLRLAPKYKKKADQVY